MGGVFNKSKIKNQILKISFILFLVLACLKSPKIPEWDTEITIPLINETFYLMDILDAKKFRIRPDSLIELYQEFTIPSQTIPLNLSPITNYQQFALSDFFITGIEPARVMVTLADIYSPTLPDSQIKLVITQFQSHLIRFYDLPQIQWLSVEQGLYKIMVYNYTPLIFDSLTINNPIPISLLNLQPNSNLSYREEFSQVSLAQRVEINIGFFSPGSFPESVLVSGRDSIVFEFQFDSLKISQGSLKLLEFIAERCTNLTLSPNHPFQIESLQIKEGTGQLFFTNNFPVRITLEAGIPQLNYFERFYIEPWTNFQTVFNFAGFSGNSLTLNLRAKADRTEDFITLSSQNALNVNYAFLDFKIGYLRGEFLTPYYITTPNVIIKTILPEAIKVKNADLFLKITNALQFPLRIRLKIRRDNQNGDSIMRETELTINPGTPKNYTLTQQVIPIAEIINFQEGKEEIKISASIQATGSGSIEEGSGVWGEGAITTPLEMALENDTIQLAERVIDIGEENRKKITNHLVSAEARAEIKNHFPLGFNARLLVVRDPLPTEDSITIPLPIPAGKVNGRRYCEAPQDTTITGDLTREGVTLFTNPRLKARLTLYLVMSDTVMVRSSDYFLINSLAKFRVSLNPK